MARYDSLIQGGELQEEVQKLSDELQAVDRELRRRDVRSATARALSRVSSFASRILPGLDVERPNDPIELSIKDLTVSVAGTDRVDYLWEIGSGANWLAYHVATTLALQQLFLELTESPVPSFVIYDQPSQVYFPWKLGTKGAPEDLDSSSLDDEDVEAVRKVFQTLASVCQASTGRLQSIVLDHASADVWGQVSGVHLVEEWREGRKLVPPEWLT